MKTMFLVYDLTDWGDTLTFDSVHSTREAAEKRLKELPCGFEIAEVPAF